MGIAAHEVNTQIQQIWSYNQHLNKRVHNLVYKSQEIG